MFLHRAPTCVQAGHVRHANGQPQFAAGRPFARELSRGGKVKSRTLANISHWPEAKIDSLRRVLAGEALLPLSAERFEIARWLAHGHVAAVLEAARRLGLDKALPKGAATAGQADPGHDRGAGRRARRQAGDGAPAQRDDRRPLARRLTRPPGSSTRGSTRTSSTPPSTFWAPNRARSGRPSRSATSRTASSCSTTSHRAISRGGDESWRFGFDRDDRSRPAADRVGLSCTPEGCPTASRCSRANSAIRQVSGQDDKLRTSFRLKRIVLVGDRGMTTQARIDGRQACRLRLDHGAARSGGPALAPKRPLPGSRHSPGSLFDERDMAETTEGSRATRARRLWRRSIAPQGLGLLCGP